MQLVLTTIPRMAGVSEARHPDEVVQEGHAAADVLPGE